MKKNYFLKSEDHHHFSLRKLTIGVASVLLGTTFMVLSDQQAHAAEVSSNDQGSVVVEDKTASAEDAQQNVQDVDVKNVENSAETNKEVQIVLTRNKLKLLLSTSKKPQQIKMLWLL
ncbi:MULTISPECIES: YSIRK-type signal peptide-containing protein [Lactobacillus]|uniref:YSIRK-type signal peptide-containing protein n=1 Tax=Lactobacillus xujianguonis TaxID=2495899 RepID=A0A437SX92_9LACO|nr:MULTISPECIES: YSIRK-type signal peptide-containing protein [Lactobacillus]RVU71546.1 YSIRK-type signal peptide-containing protein [Lactobacillus xujianguonis]RVU76733.1 YSIRK-type signal peptide-containing protein [Lactobacillus xujianguonis]